MNEYNVSKNRDFIPLHGDEQINNLNQQVDMIFAYPPYFLSQGITKRINGTWKNLEKGEWDRVGSLDEINAFNLQWFIACRDKLKDNGTIWVCGTYHNILSVASCMAELGGEILKIRCKTDFVTKPFQLHHRIHRMGYKV